MSLPAALLLALLQTKSQTVPLKLIRAGITQMTGGYMNRTVPLSSTKPDGLTGMPSGLKNPLYGVLKLAGQRFTVVLATKGNSQVLLVDSNSNGTMQDDARPIWVQKTGDTPGSGIAEIRIPFGGHRAACNVLLIQSGLKSLTAIADYGFQGQLSLGKQSIPFILMDSSGSGFENGSPVGSTLGFDRLGGRKPIDGTEQYAGDQPFTINGDSYEMTSVDLASSSATFKPGEKVPERPIPLLLEPGNTAPTFTESGLDGKSVNFPSDFKDHTVLIYVWSTASSPSLQWLPRVKRIYEANHSKGLDVLGICLDDSSNTERARAQIAQMPWTTAFDGKSWRGDATRALAVESLPFLILVDGSTGKIIATMGEMLGDGLEKAVAGVLH